MIQVIELGHVDAGVGGAVVGAPHRLLVAHHVHRVQRRIGPEGAMPTSVQIPDLPVMS